jgi:hypothetical protein
VEAVALVAFPVILVVAVVAHRAILAVMVFTELVVHGYQQRPMLIPQLGLFQVLLISLVLGVVERIPYPE